MSQKDQQDALEVELIRSLFDVAIPAAIMSVGFIAAGSLMAWETHDPILILLVIVGAIATTVRLAIMITCRRQAMNPTLSIDRARLLQLRYAVPNFAFAGVLGMFGYHALNLPFPEIHMLTICMLVGYSAGISATAGLRPRIAIASMLAAVVPALNAALHQPDIFYWATALLASGFLTGGVSTVRRRHARAVKSIGRRLAFSTLARQDGLTALPNRLALREWFDERVSFATNPGMVAVHYLDLDGFKPVNDQHGHAAGDALLIAVSKRIARTIRSNDTAARLGGDEFAIVQCGIASAEDAALLAQRLATAIARAYRIEGNTITVSTSVGYVVAEHGAEDLDCLLTLADEALYASKRRGGGVTQWNPELDDQPRAAA